MKKIITLLLTLTLCVAMLGSCGKKPENKTLVLGFDAEYPPFGYVAEDGSYVGFDLEYATLVGNKLGYTIEFKPIEWASKDSMIASGAIDMIWNGFTYEGREDEYAWTDRYLDNSIVVLTTTNSGIASLADLAGKTVTVQSESSGEQALKKESNAELVASFADGKYLTDADYSTAFTKLESGAVDAIVVDIGVAKYLIQNKTGYTILTGDNVISKETYGVGFAKENTALAAEFTRAMKQVAAEGDTIKDLCEKYGLEFESFILD